MNHSDVHTKPKILLVDDEVEITQNIASYLNFNGYDSLVAENGHEALILLESEKPNLMVLDIDMPIMAGLPVLEELSRRKSAIPVIVLSKFSEVGLQISSLNLGAVSYLEKPFPTDILIAYINRHVPSTPTALPTASSTASSTASPNMLVCNELTLSLRTMQVSVDDQVIKLPPQLFQVLEYLMQNSERWFSAEQLLAVLFDDCVEKGSLPVAISKLKKKLPSLKHTIENYNGGYIFSARVIRI